MIKITESNVTIMVRDLDSSIRFYGQIGLELKQRWDNHYAMVSADGITIGLHPGGGDASGSGSVSVGFMIDDINAAKSLLESTGIPYKEDDGKSGHYLHFSDPDNTVLYFVLPKWREWQ